MRRELHFRLIAAPVCAALFLLSACATIVRHPEVAGVKRVAIVSLYTNQEISKVGGGGSNSGGAAFLTKLAKGNDESATDDKDLNNRVRLAKYALDRFEKALGKVPGWKVVSSDLVVKSAEYKKLGKPKTENRALASVMDIAGRVHQARFNTPPGMWAIPLKESDHDPELVANLKSLAKTLKVDAVAVVDVDLAYDSGFAIGGTGTAKASVAASTKVLNSEGGFAVVFPDNQAGAGKRFESSKETGMLGGKIYMTGRTEQAFQEAIDRTADYTAQVITEGLAKKE